MISGSTLKNKYRIMWRFNCIGMPGARLDF